MYDDQSIRGEYDRAGFNNTRNVRVERETIGVGSKATVVCRLKIANSGYFVAENGQQGPQAQAKEWFLNPSADAIDKQQVNAEIMIFCEEHGWTLASGDDDGGKYELLQPVGPKPTSDGPYIGSSPLGHPGYVRSGRARWEQIN